MKRARAPTRRALFLVGPRTSATLALLRLHEPVAVLASSPRVTAFVPLGPFSVEERIHALATGVYELVADDRGVMIRWHPPRPDDDGPGEEESLRFTFGKPFVESDASIIFLGIAGPLERRAAKVAELTTLSVAARDRLLKQGELEARIGLPALDPPPERASLAELRRLFPSLRLVGAAAETTPRPVARRPTGHAFHLGLPHQRARDVFHLLGVRATVVATNARWTTFRVDGPFELEKFLASSELRVREPDVSAIALDWNEASGLRARLHCGWMVYELVVQTGKPLFEAGSARVFLALIAERGSAAVNRVREALHQPVAQRDAWLAEGGFERTLGLPTSVLEPGARERPRRRR